MLFRSAQEMQHLIALVNRQNATTHWLIPTPFWPESLGIAHPKTVVCPDLVLQEFPLRFADPATEATYARILNTLQNAESLITYSEYTKQVQLVQGVGVAPEQVTVIPHARVDLNGCLSLGNKATGKVRSMEERREIALEVLRHYQRSTLHTNPFWSRTRWDQTRFVFYSSQSRGHKNILSLLRSIEILRHRAGEPVRAVLTCERTPDSEIDLFLKEHQLDAWVLFAPQVSNTVLAALYCNASLAVNPSLFEGGFPFTFSEAYSVGTPSVMSDVGVVREFVLNEELRRRMLFNPHDPRDMAGKIQWGIDHRQELLELQTSLDDPFSTWDVVASNY